MIDKKTLDRWYDEGQEMRKLNSEKLQYLSELKNSLKSVVNKIKQIRPLKVACPINWKVRSNEEIMELIIGK